MHFGVHFGSILEPSGVTLGSIWARWGPFGLHLGPLGTLWAPFGLFGEPFGVPSASLGSFLDVWKANRVLKRVPGVIFMLFERILLFFVRFPELVRYCSIFSVNWGPWSRLRRRRRRRPHDMQCSVSQTLDVSSKVFAKLQSLS